MIPFFRFVWNVYCSYDNQENNLFFFLCHKARQMLPEKAADLAKSSSSTLSSSSSSSSSSFASSSVSSVFQVPHARARYDEISELVELLQMKLIKTRKVRSSLSCWTCKKIVLCVLPPPPLTSQCNEFPCPIQFVCCISREFRPYVTLLQQICHFAEKRGVNFIVLR